MSSYRRLAWSDVTVPTELAEVVDEISYQRVVMNPGATWDYFPGHYDPAYAESHGHPTIFVNTMHLAGFVDRIGSVYAGDSMVGRGRVVDKRHEKTGDTMRYLVDLEIAIFNQRDELCCPAELTLELAG